MKSLRYIAFLSVFLGLVSCSVKENRKLCPVYLCFGKVGNPYECDGDAVVYGFTNRGNDIDFRREIAIRELLSGERFIPLSAREGLVTMMALMGNVVGSVDADCVYRIPEGEQMDSVFAFADRIETMEDDYWVKGSILRQFADVTLTVSFPNETCQFGLDVQGASCGFNVRNLAPVEGSFRFSMQSDADGICRFRLPRQKPEGQLHLLISDEGRGMTPLYSVMLSEYLAMSGYDWTASDLASISLKIDFSHCAVSVGIGDWEHVFTLNVVI